MEVSARFLRNSKFEVEARGHLLVCDQPRDNGGEDAGMSPPEFLLASLATCAGYYAAQYLKTRGIDCAGLGVSVTAEKGMQPARLASFHIDLAVPKLETRHEAPLLRAVKTCLIHNTLLNEPRIEVALHRQPAIHPATIGSEIAGLEARN